MSRSWLIQQIILRVIKPGIYLFQVHGIFSTKKEREVNQEKKTAQYSAFRLLENIIL